MSDEKSFDQLEDQVRECFARVAYSHKTHEKMADRCAATLSRLKTGQIAATALTSSGAAGVILIDEFWLKVATAIISFVTLFLSAYMKSFDPGGIAQKHRDAAAKLWGVRESYFSLLADMSEMSLADVRARRNELQELLQAIYLSAPQTNGKAYADAQDSLKNKEELTFTVEEIDCFLPEPLKKANRRKADNA